jgi:hypothetical protein
MKCDCCQESQKISLVTENETATDGLSVKVDILLNFVHQSPSWETDSRSAGE